MRGSACRAKRTAGARPDGKLNLFVLPDAPRCHLLAYDAPIFLHSVPSGHPPQPRRV